MMPAESYSYVSSRLVKEVFQLGGRVTDLVPPVVERRLSEKYGTPLKAGRTRRKK
jgi:pantetheine-phosphate adenylyltransferase